MRIIFVILLLFCFDSLKAEMVPTFSSGDQLINNCEQYLSKSGRYNAAAIGCYHYIAGAIDSMYVQISGFVSLDCYSNETGMFTLDQIIRIVVKDLSQKPEILNQQAASIVSSIFFKNFPIPQKCYIKNKQKK